MRIRSLGLVAFYVSFAAACGGGDDAISLVIDAGPADAEPVPDSEPPPPCPDDECDGTCTNFDNDEAFCGDCTTQCTGGESCTSGACACPAAFVPANPAFLGSQLTDMLPGAITGFGLYGNPTGGFFADALGVAYPVDENGASTVTIGTDYTLAGKLSAPGILAGYNVDIQNMTADAAYAVTAGTVTFDAICATGFQGHAANLTFSGINSLTDPTIDPEGCMFNVAALTFSFGDDCTP